MHNVDPTGHGPVWGLDANIEDGKLTSQAVEAASHTGMNRHGQPTKAPV